MERTAKCPCGTIVKVKGSRWKTKVPFRGRNLQIHCCSQACLHAYNSAQLSYRTMVEERNPFNKHLK